MTFSRQRLSVAAQRGIVSCILGTCVQWWATEAGTVELDNNCFDVK